MIGPLPYHGESNYMIVKTDYRGENVKSTPRLRGLPLQLNKSTDNAFVVQGFMQRRG